VAAVRASGLVKRFEAVCAVDHVDLVVEEGEVRGLLGPNGAGKTTLLRMLFGLVGPDAGSVALFDRPLEPDDRWSLEGVAGFVEDPSFYPYPPGRVNLELLAELDGAGAEGRVNEVLERVGLSTRGDDRVSGYSTGMRQRLGIAASLLREPRLLLLDEPTAGLDPAGVRDVGALLRALSADGVSVLLSSHQIGEIEDTCDGFTVLSRGRVVWDGTSAQMRGQAPASVLRMATSDDEQALLLAARQPGVQTVRGQDGGLAVTVARGALDPFVLALGQHGIAVRRLQLLSSPLESMFFALTAAGETEDAALLESAFAQT